ncbi:MAG: hypothetical protein IJ043_00515 [Clostridia bacterium]|nr:hypothetical protein [Clostridia bacterium]
MLIGQFWGTGAAEGIPAPFCRCSGCEYARKMGGKEVRLRSCFRLTDSIMIDLGADAVVQSIKYGEITGVNHVVVTHTHDDHLNPHMLMESMWAQEKEEYRYRGTLHYYLTDQAFEIVEHWRNNPWILKGKVREFEEKGYIAFHKQEFGQRFEIEGIGFTPLRGNHRGNVGEDAAMYLIELSDGRKLFYGLDSSTYYPETLKALKEHHIDIYISENAVGALKNAEPHPSHMRLCDVRELAEALFNQGTIDGNSLLYLTHINHRSTHKENEEGVKELNFPVKTIVAYDGLKIF